jgi:hypothetical protein
VPDRRIELALQDSAADGNFSEDARRSRIP